MNSKPPARTPSSRPKRQVPPPLPRRPPKPVDFGPRPVLEPPRPALKASKTPSFSEAPTESPTGKTGKIVGDWRMLLQLFDELEPEGKDALAQIGHALLKAQVARKNRVGG